MWYRLNRLDEPALMAVPKPMLTDFDIHHRLESCALGQIFQSNAFSIAEAGANNLLVNTSQLLGDGVWTQHPTTSQTSNSKLNQEMNEGRQLERPKIFKATEFFPAPEVEPHS